MNEQQKPDRRFPCWTIDGDRERPKPIRSFLVRNTEAGCRKVKAIQKQYPGCVVVEHQKPQADGRIRVEIFAAEDEAAITMLPATHETIESFFASQYLNVVEEAEQLEAAAAKGNKQDRTLKNARKVSADERRERLQTRNDLIHATAGRIKNYVSKRDMRNKVRAKLKDDPNWRADWKMPGDTQLWKILFKN